MNSSMRLTRCRVPAPRVRCSCPCDHARGQLAWVVADQTPQRPAIAPASRDPDLIGPSLGRDECRDGPLANDAPTSMRHRPQYFDGPHSAGAHLESKLSLRLRCTSAQREGPGSEPGNSLGCPDGVACSVCGVLGGNQCRASLLHKQHKQHVPRIGMFKHTTP